ncbi:MAG: hypothetical protein JOZ86_16530 [Candidatus Eremiobacteraeota bacterium]|nr:hypothetical protein [Candidatus Eremiobacteraeota bacterium]
MFAVVRRRVGRPLFWPIQEIAMFRALLAALRRLFIPAPAETKPAVVAPETPGDWWIPKDRKALQAAKAAKRRAELVAKLSLSEGGVDSSFPAADRAVAEKLADEKLRLEQVPVPAEAAATAAIPTAAAAPPNEAAAPPTSLEANTIDLDLEELASLDDVAALLEDRRRAKDEEALRIESVEIPQAMMMDDDEYAVARDWMTDHRTLHPLPKTLVYGQYWVRFGRSSVGDSVTIGCTTCGANKILTDLSQTEPRPSQASSA